MDFAGDVFPVASKPIAGQFIDNTKIDDTSSFIDQIHKYVLECFSEISFSTILAEMDNICDYIPGLGTFSNLIDIFLKCVVAFLPKEVVENRYLTHINHKGWDRCFIGLVPLAGNGYNIYADYTEYKEDEARYAQQIQSLLQMQKQVAAQLVLQAKMCGVTVSAEDMMPAVTKDQQRLWKGCQENNFHLVSELLNQSIHPNFYHSGMTPLVTALQQGESKLVNLLIQNGADVNTPNRFGISPLIAACTKSDLDLVQALLPHVADINESTPLGVTPLMMAAFSGHQEIAAFLIKQGADLSRKAKDGNDVVSNTIFPKDSVEILPMLLRDDEDIDARKYQHQAGWFASINNLTPLLYATLMGSIKCAMYLLPRSNVRASDNANNTALFYSVKNVTLLQAILEKCNKPEFINQQNIVGSTALHHAIDLECPDAAILLLKCGADPFIPNKKGQTPLILACERGLTEVVDYIQENRKIDAALQEQLNNTKIIVKSVDKQPDLLQSFSSLLNTAQRLTQSFQANLEKTERKDKEFGPIPRTAMEILLGKLEKPF